MLKRRDIKMEFRTPSRSEYRAHSTHRESRAEPAQAPTKHRIARLNSLSRSWWKLLIALVVLAIVVWLAYGYIHTKHQLDKLSSNSKSASQSATQQVIDQVGKLVQLPTGETPTLATVNDASKLKNQAFFKDAQNGDKVLIYTKAGKAVLYRPSTNRIIEFSSVNLNGSGT